MAAQGQPRDFLASEAYTEKTVLSQSFLKGRAGWVIMDLFRWLMNRIAAPDVMGRRPSIDLCGSCA